MDWDVQEQGITENVWCRYAFMLCRIFCIFMCGIQSITFDRDFEKQ